MCILVDCYISKKATQKNKKYIHETYSSELLFNEIFQSNSDLYLKTKGINYNNQLFENEREKSTFQHGRRRRTISGDNRNKVWEFTEKKIEKKYFLDKL